MLDLFDLEPKDRMLAQLLQSQGLISAEQLRVAFGRLRTSLFYSLAEVLIGDGVVTLEQMEQVIADYCQNLRFGELAVARGLIFPEQLELALAMQDGRQLRLGEVFVELRLATPEQVAMLLDFQNRCRLATTATA